MKYAKPKIIIIVGPTASGKTNLGIKLAKKFNGEIISADSRQVYRGMNIGTGKVTKKEMSGIKHYMLDVVSPKKIFTVADYQKLGQAVIKKIIQKRKLPIIVGGTGLYVDALINNTTIPDVKPNVKLRKQFDKLTAEYLFKMLRKLDSKRAKNIDQHNKRRLIRALEIIKATGRPIPPATTTNQYTILKLGLKPTEKKLKKIIHKRLIARIKKGMIGEVARLHKNGLSWQRLDDLGLEYRWVSRYLRDLISKEEMIITLEKEIWHYAKRQMTWFKRDQNLKWIKTQKLPIDLVKKWYLKK